jgi:hypothetical protein
MVFRIPGILAHGTRQLCIASAVLALVAVVASGSIARADVPATGGLDCNGFSTLQGPTVPQLHLLCLDVRPAPGDDRSEDNGHYIGHDEPMITFYSNTPGSANNVQWLFRLPVERPLPATQSFQNFITYWFSMALCDPKSTPFGPCIPNSDSNDPLAAGGAILELQFYPPGEGLAPNVNLACSMVDWCAALNIDSLTGNGGCLEPVNFAYVQVDGIPIGPPGPGSQTIATFTPTTATLQMHPGDLIRVTIKDTPAGLETLVEDLTTHQSGFMVASAANGFQNTDPVTCLTSPFSFHPEFSTATTDHIVPWALARANISFAMEIGHFETADADGDDVGCFPASSIIGPLVAGCFGTDDDFDGTSYQRDWPDGTTHNATSIMIKPPSGRGLGPLSMSASGRYVHPFTQFQFESGAPATDPNCVSPSTCVIPPTGAAFYPYYSFQMTHDSAECIILFGDHISSSIRGINSFGGDLQYGASDVARAFQEKVSALHLNPCLHR